MKRLGSIQPPEYGSHLLVTTPRPHVLVLTLNRPKALNAMTAELKADIDKVLSWFESEPELWFVPASRRVLPVP